MEDSDVPSSIDSLLNHVQPILPRLLKFVSASRPDPRPKHSLLNAVATLPTENDHANGSEKNLVVLPAPTPAPLPNTSSVAATADATIDDGPPPVRVPSHLLQLSSRTELPGQPISRIGCGLHNLMNSCFFNSALQCLTYTEPLARYCLRHEHSRLCAIRRSGSTDVCLMCMFEAHVCAARKGGAAISPQSFYGQLRSIGKQFRAGRQEDAHEFLRLLLEALAKQAGSVLSASKSHSASASSASPASAPAPAPAPTPLTRAVSTRDTIVHLLFGGHLRSQVKCALCGYESNVFDPFLDLSLEIAGCSTLLRALARFTAAETLDEQNQYLCARCHRRSCATKRLTIHHAPHILTVQLKRFRTSLHRWHDTKISKFVEFPEKLSLKPFMSHPQPATYQLYAVLVHLGDSTRSGHYFCFVRHTNNVWYCMNDASVSQVAASSVMKQQAYVLFYTRDQMANTTNTTNTTNTVNTVNNAPVAVPTTLSHSPPHENDSVQINGSSNFTLQVPKNIALSVLASQQQSTTVSTAPSPSISASPTTTVSVAPFVAAMSNQPFLIEAIASKKRLRADVQSDEQQQQHQHRTEDSNKTQKREHAFSNDAELNATRRNWIVTNVDNTTDSSSSETEIPSSASTSNGGSISHLILAMSRRVEKVDASKAPSLTSSSSSSSFSNISKNADSRFAQQRSREVLQWLATDGQKHRSVNHVDGVVDRWENASSEEVIRQQTLLRSAELLPEVSVRDDWDYLYDQGRAKKSKKKQNQEQQRLENGHATNPFESYLRQQERQPRKKFHAGAKRKKNRQNSQ